MNIYCNKKVITIIISWEKKDIQNHLVSCCINVIIGVMKYTSNEIINNIIITKTFCPQVRTNLRTDSKIGNLIGVYFAFILSSKKSCYN